jgi:nitric oxide reductase subunit B
MGRSYVRLIEWCRMPGDLVFIFLGVVPMVMAAALTYWTIIQEKSISSPCA